MKFFGCWGPNLLSGGPTFLPTIHGGSTLSCLLFSDPNGTLGKGILLLSGFNVVDLDTLSWINTLRISLSIHGDLVYRCCFDWLLIGAKKIPIVSLRC